MVLIVVVVLVALGRVATVRGWPGTAAVGRWWGRVHPSVVAYVRGFQRRLCTCSG